MLAAPPPRRAARARNVRPCSPLVSRRATASVRTASSECEARRRPRAGRSRTARASREGRAACCRWGLMCPSHHTIPGRTCVHRTTFDSRTVFDERRRHMTTTTPTRTYPSLRAAWIPMLALCLAFFVEMVDNTLLTIALPTIGRDLGSGTTALQWVTGAY